MLKVDLCLRGMMGESVSVHPCLARAAAGRPRGTQPGREMMLASRRLGHSCSAIAVATILVVCVFAPSVEAFEFEKSITIDRSRIDEVSCGATLVDYPMLFSVTDADLSHTSFGGEVTDLGGDDIIFRARDAGTCGGPAVCVLDHEIEKYDNTTGELVAWVRIPSVNTAAAGSDTTVYVSYGDVAVTTSTENPTGVWDADFKGVWHLGEDVTDEATGGTHGDSTSNANDGTQNGNVEATGQIADGQDFDGADDRISIANVIGAANAVTFSAWVKHENLMAVRERYIELSDVVVIRHDGPNSVGQLDFYVRNGGLAQHLRVNGVLSNGVWTHVAGTWDGTTQRLFLNGAEVASQLPAGSLDPIVFGNISDEASEPMNGVIDEVRISDTARSACWIDAEHENQFDPGDIGAAGFYTVGSAAALPGYDYRKRVTIDRSMISDGTCGATLTDFPMLFSSIDPELRHTSFGGDVTDLGGDDIIFRGEDAVTCGAAPPCDLDHEIERYDNTTGELVAWVRLPSVNTAFAGSDTQIVVYYGDISVTSPTENPAGVWDASYAGVWHLEEQVTDEATGGTHDDSTGGNDGAQRRNDDYVGEGHYAQTFDGANDYILVADDDNLTFVNGGTDDPFSLSAWVKGDNDEAVIIAKDGASGREYDWWIDNSGAIVFEVFDSESDGPGVYTTSTISTGWHHVAATYDGSEAYTGMTLYIDGVAQTLVDITVTPYDGMSNTAMPVNIGAYDNGGNVYDFNGQIDEARISSTVRSACWIGASYNNQVWPDKTVTPSPDPSPNPSEGFYGLGAATAVELVSFTAYGLDSAVELWWETGSELDNLGFELYRSLSEEGPWERVTASLIPGLGSSPAGARYRFLDTGVTNGVTYFYELEDVENTGRVQRHSPVSATPSASAGSALPDEIDAAVRLTYGEPEASAFRIERKRNGVVLTLHTSGFVAAAQDDGTVSLEVPGLENVVGSSLPLKRAWVEALSGRDVKMVSVRAVGLERFAGLRPGGELVSELEASSDGTVRARLRRGRRQLRREGAKLLETAYQGETKKALFELSPFAWDGSGLVLATTLEVHVAFRGREPSLRVSRRKGKASVRLVTVEPGLHAVPLRELAGRRRDLRLSRQGEDVAYHIEDDVLYFWSEGAEENPYGSEAVYELERGVAGRTMEVSAPGSETEWYWEELEQEENRYYQAALVDAPDVWLWDVLSAPQRKAYAFEVHEPVSGPAHLEVWLQGTSDVGAGEDHHVRVYVNGNYVTESWWDGKTARTLSVELAADVLRDGDNTLELDSVADTGATYSSVMLDRFRVRYPRQATRLQSARYVLELSGATPRWVESRTGFDPDGRYVATDVVHRPELRPVLRTKLRKRRRTDYLVIGPESMLRTARPLLRHRRRQGLRVRTASTEAIASEFGDGELTPESIRALIADVYHNGRGPKLRYVLLLGDATYDYKDYMETGVVNQVPPFMVKTSFLWTASDPIYAAVNGDDLLPDLAIGRLPAASVDELRTMVEKILAYETGGASMEAPIVLVSDNPDEAGDFPADAHALANTVLAEHAPRHISLDTLGVVPAREAILHAFDDGASVLSYIGHGGINLWANENLLNLKSVDSLQPRSQQPVVLTMNCLNGYFHFPFFDSLSEALVKSEGKGAIAAFSPSGLSLNAPAHRYHQALLNELFHGNHQRLGDAVMAAQEAYADTGAFPELLSIYHLLGDPALTLR